MKVSCGFSESPGMVQAEFCIPGRSRFVSMSAAEGEEERREMKICHFPTAQLLKMESQTEMGDGKMSHLTLPGVNL